MLFSNLAVIMWIASCNSSSNHSLNKINEKVIIASSDYENDPYRTMMQGCTGFNDYYHIVEHEGNGVTNIFVGITGFNEKDSNCWGILSELYNNMAPDSLIREQNAYFIYVSDTSKHIRVRSRAQLMASDSIRNMVIGINSFDTTNAEISKFTALPFRKL